MDILVLALHDVAWSIACAASVPVEEIIEAPVARETASVTGGGGNPQHTAHLDSINLEIEGTNT